VKGESRVIETTVEAMKHELLEAVEDLRRRVESGKVQSLYILALQTQDCGDPDCPGIHIDGFYRGRVELSGGMISSLMDAAEGLIAQEQSETVPERMQ
jgi:hypothetical protein